MEKATADQSLNSDLETQARSGDALAFGQLIRLHDDALRGAVWHMLRDRHALDDVMQQSYEKAFKSIKNFKGESSTKTWLHSVCHRTALDHLRYEGRRKHADIDERLDVSDDSQSTEDASVAKLTLLELLESADPETRALLMLTGGLGYSYDETAEITGLERGTVASRVARAKAKLRTEANQ